jgi:hypothetical protein
MSKGRNLIITGLRIGIQDASPSDHLLGIDIRGVVYNGVEFLLNEKVPYMNAQRLEKSFAPMNCGQFDAVKVVLHLKCTQPHGVDISFVNLQCTYE